MRIVRLKRLGLLKESREVFDILHSHGIISADVQRKMHGLVSFRNTAGHNYKKLDLNIVEAVILNHLGDLRELATTAIHLKM
jgi:uncharacterized protein YutE (UPF0331/DUF86 family)